MLTEEIFEKLNEKYNMIPGPVSDYETFQMVGLDFTAKGYDSSEMGHVSLMKASGMGGAMQMESMIVNPFFIDGPLFSLDLIVAQGKHTLLMELYDTLLTIPRDEAPFQAIKDGYDHIPNIPQKPCWYDDIHFHASIAKAASDEQAEDLSALIRAYSARYLDLLADAPSCEEAKKRVKANAYRDGLLSHGGPATDAFLQTWGMEKTGRLFTEVLFG